MLFLTRIFLIVVTASFAVGAPLNAAGGEKRQNTTRHGLKAIPRNAASATNARLDTIAGEGDAVEFYGYEKTLRSMRETVFVTNRSARTIAALRFTIRYYDAQGRLLHSRIVNTSAEIPPGETRRVDFPSWDKQCTFYYSGSPRPRTSAIPYSIKITGDTILVAPTE